MAAAVSEDNIRKHCVEFEEHLRKFADEKGDDLEAAWIEKMEYVIPRYVDVFSSRVSDLKNTTLLHGDLHLWNFVYPKDTAPNRLILLDWETYKRGLGPYDLAYLLVHGTSGRLEVEANLKELYYSRLTDQVSGYPKEAFEYYYRLSIVSTTFCPLFWKRPFPMRSAIDAYSDWDCDESLA